MFGWESNGELSIEKCIWKNLLEQMRYGRGSVPIAGLPTRILTQVDQCVNGERTVFRWSVSEPTDDLAMNIVLVGRVQLRFGVPAPAASEEVADHCLGEQHLATAQHTAPATVRRVIGAVQNGEFPAIGHPQATVEIPPEAVDA